MDEVGSISAYQVNKVGYGIVHDRTFRKQVVADRRVALERADLEPEERELLFACDVAELYRRGAHEFLHFNLVRLGAFGLSPGSPPSRIRQAAERG